MSDFYYIFAQNIIKMNRMSKTTDFNWKDESGKIIHVYIETYCVSQANDIIIRYINDTYGKFGVKYREENIIFSLGEKIINSKYISLFVNNKTIFTNTIRRENIKDSVSFVNYIKEHLKDMYHYDGVYFSQNYNTTKNTSNKGNRGESICLPYFSKMLNERCNEILTIFSPKVGEDIDGSDGYFFYKNIRINIQVKPFSKFSIIDDTIVVTSDGALKLDANYLILYKENLEKKLYDIIILKNGIDKNLISYNLTEYKTNIENFIKFEKDIKAI